MLQVFKQIDSFAILIHVFLELGFELLKMLVLVGRLLLEVGLFGLVAENGALQQRIVPRIDSFDGHLLGMLASLLYLLKR